MCESRAGRLGLPVRFCGRIATLELERDRSCVKEEVDVLGLVVHSLLSFLPFYSKSFHISDIRWILHMSAMRLYQNNDRPKKP